MNFSIIQKSQLEGALRIDAEYYQPEYLELDKELSKYRDKLKNFVEILEKGNSLTGGATPLGAQYPDGGIKFLRVQNIMPGYFDFSDIVFIDNNMHNSSLRRSRLIDDDVLLTITGVSYGKANVYKKVFGEGNINQHSVRMHFISSLIPEYISTFLNSKYGHFQSDRKITGNSRPALAYEEIRSYKIPLISLEDQLKIKKICNSSLEEENNSIELYDKAEELLLEELGLKNVKFEDNLFYTVNFSDVKDANRLDADYFQPKYERLVEKLKSQDVKPFAQVVEIVNAGFSPKPDKSYNYVDLGNINSSTGLIDGFEEVLGRKAPSRAKRVLRGDDVIVSSVEGSLGKVALVGERQNGYLASTGFFQLRSKDVLPEVLLILTKSIVMQWQMKKHCAGTILTAVPSEALNKMVIPVLSIEKQSKIAELVKKSHDVRRRSKELLDQAKREVEEMIELEEGNND